MAKKTKGPSKKWTAELHPRGHGGKFASKGIPKISELHKDALHKALATKGMTLKHKPYSAPVDIEKFKKGKMTLAELKATADKLNLTHPIKYKNRKASWHDVITKHLNAHGVTVPEITAKPAANPAKAKATPKLAKDSEAYAKKHHTLLGSGVEGQVYHDGKGTAFKFYNRQTPVPDKTIQDMKTLGEMGIGPKFISHKQVKVHGLDRTQPVVAMEHLTGYKTGLSTEAIPSHLANIKKLHAAGYVPDDLHDDNIMSKGKEAKLIDTSLSTATPKAIAAQLLDIYGSRPDTAQTIQSVLEGRGAGAKAAYKKLQRQYKDNLTDAEYKRLADELWGQLEGKAAPKSAPVEPKKVTVPPRGLEVSHKDLIATGHQMLEKHGLLGGLTKREKELKRALDAAEKECRAFDVLKEGQEAYMKIAAKYRAAYKAYDDELEVRHNKMEAGYKAMVKELITHHGIKPEQAMAHIKGLAMDKAHPVNPAKMPIVEQALKEMYMLTGGKTDMLTNLREDDPRAYASRSEKTINVGDGQRQTMYHEAAHHIEYKHMEIMQAAVDFRAERATSKKLVIKGNEEYVKDHFVHEYAGRVYGGDMHDLMPTEIVSMGLQHFTSTRNLHRLQTADIEHLKFSIGVALY